MDKLLFFLIIAAMLFPNTIEGHSEEVVAVADSLCVQDGEEFIFNVKDNDISPLGFFPPVFLLTPSECFIVLENGDVQWTQNATDCCGEHLLLYQYDLPNQQCIGELVITVKCPKPECFIVELELPDEQMSPGGFEEDCIYTCENSEASYFVPYNPLNNYNWTVIGGSYVPGSNPAEIMVSWGTAGSGTILLTITDPSNQSVTYNFCVEILTGPIASFEKSDTCVCLNGPISFTNNSLGATGYYWDFGDGNASSAFSPTHTYANPGSYTVTLYATNNNYDPMGNPLCCCTDSTSMEVIVDPLSGPNIYWVSTLCAGDSSKYWTDAGNCSSYQWTVLDENNLPISFLGQGNDTICVQWGNGPVGTISLEVMNCDSSYCDKPSTVTIPIIPPVSQIVGPETVCENGVGTYTIPKWLSTYYDWQVIGGLILSGQGSNTVIIQWGLAPGPGQIVVDYCSEFLAGLPEQEPLDCKGTGSLNVSIKPEFELFGPFPNLVCTNSSSSISATSFPSSSYTWSISPPASFSGQGSSSITVNWDNGPGVFIISAIPNDTTIYCNDVEQTTVTVLELAPPDSIDGPLEICPDGTDLYFANSSASGVGFIWNVTGGTPAVFTGNPLVVTWNSTGPYSVSLQQFQLNAPFCVSDSISINPTAKLLNGPLAISGPDACTNEVQTYTSSPAQHPEANYSWSIIPSSMGSIISGQGTPGVQIQWNDDSGSAIIQLIVEICDDMLSTTLAVNLDDPLVPTILQIGNLCPGGTAILDAGPGYIAYSWSTLDVTQTININSAGTYIVTTTDSNNCTAVDAITVNEDGGPVASISTPDPNILCIIPPNGNTITISALTNSGYTYMWYCDGILQSFPSTQAFLTHTNTNVLDTFNYWVVVTDSNGCMNTSNIITVIQTDDCVGGGPGGCNSKPYSLSLSAVNQTPDCNIVDFTVTASPNVTPLSWNFNDPANNTNTGTLTNAIHAYSQAGYYLADFTATVPELPPGNGSCIVGESIGVCIPIAADFSFTDSCSTVSFTDLSTFLPGNNITSWSWDFGDFNNSSMQNPIHSYASPGTYTVTLTISNAAGCQASLSLPITISVIPAISMTILPNPACVDDVLNYTGSGTDIINWNWDFGDGANNGSQNPSHSYSTPGTFLVTLTGTNSSGCESTVTSSVSIFPLPPADTIAYIPSLVVCDGDTVTLTAPLGAGYSFIWSTGSSSSSIDVTTAGYYGVTITDPNDCELIPDSVLVEFLPLPDASISGNPIICDEGCTELSAPGGFGYSYQWFDHTNSPITGQTNQTIMICTPSILPFYYVEVTDLNGCKNTSIPISIMVATSPSFNVQISPDSCEISPSLLSVVPVQTDVVYNWSNGDSGSSTTVTVAGSYTVIGTDTLTGCTHTEIATIYPRPDLCIVPSGCYEVCNPDTICGPPGLASYQWNMNGLPIISETDSCLIVTQSGSYSLTGINQYGCETTSDTLILSVIECDSTFCDSLMIMVSQLDVPLDSCCYSFDYIHNDGDLAGLMISSTDTDFNIDLGSIHPSLAVQSFGTNWIGLGNSSTGLPLPTGTLSNFIEICLINIQQNPQQLIFDWYNLDNEIACSDTLIFNCPVEPDCLYLAQDSIYCVQGQIFYDITLCNPLDAVFSIGFIQLIPVAPIGVTFMPSFFDESTNPINPGECRDYTLAISGANIEDQLLCWELIGHQANPEVVDTALCCSLDTSYYIMIPDCNPCDDIGVEFLQYSDPAIDSGCCFDLFLFNNYDANYFTEIGLCLLDSTGTMTLNNPFGSGWLTNWYSGDSIVLTPTSPIGNHIPLGVFSLPEICVNTNQAPPQLLEVKWMLNDSIACRDTIELFCEPDCGYISEEEVICLEDGTWDYYYFIKNTSDYVMDEAFIQFTSPTGMSAYDHSVSLGGLLPGNFAGPFLVNLGPPAMQGDTICMTIALHEIGHDSLHTNCCIFNHCIVLPPCDPDCNCDDEFIIEVQQGIGCQLDPILLSGSFWPLGNLTLCDQVFWEWSDTIDEDQTTGNDSVDHTFEVSGIYQVCMNVVRTDLNGVVCESEYCKQIDLFIPREDILLFPNPASEKVWMRFHNKSSKSNIRVYDLNYRLIIEKNIYSENDIILHELDMEEFASGLYLIKIENGDQIWLKKLVIE